MRTDRNEAQRLADMMRYAHLAHEAGGIIPLSLFIASPMLKFTTCYALRTVGEAAYHVGAETREKLPEIPWRQIVMMRHRLVHDYFKIDYDIVWQVAAEHAPALVAQLDPVVGPAGREPNLEVP